MSALETLELVDSRDAYTAGHSARVHQLALAVGSELGLSGRAGGNRVRGRATAALYHDIGKAAIPDEILLKPARLTEDEWELMRRHSDEGARMVEEAGVPPAAV